MKQCTPSPAGEMKIRNQMENQRYNGRFGPWYINSYIKCKWSQYINKKIETNRVDLETWPDYMLSTKDSLQI